MEDKPYASEDYTYCVNKSCTEKVFCAKYEGNYTFDIDSYYSFCKYKEKTCPYSESNNK